MVGHALTFESALELAAGGIDVAAAGLAQVDRNSLNREHGPESLNCFRIWRRESDAGTWVPCDQIDFRRQAGAAHQARNLAGVLRSIGDPAEQDIFKGDALPWTQRDAVHGFDDLRDGPLAIDWHYLRADLVIGRVKADGELRTKVGRFL